MIKTKKKTIFILLIILALWLSMVWLLYSYWSSNLNHIKGLTGFEFPKNTRIIVYEFDSFLQGHGCYALLEIDKSDLTEFIKINHIRPRKYRAGISNDLFTDPRWKPNSLKNYIGVETMNGLWDTKLLISLDERMKAKIYIISTR